MTAYFSAHDSQGRQGMDWLRLRIDVLTRVRAASRPEEQDEAQGESTPAPH